MYTPNFKLTAKTKRPLPAKTGIQVHWRWQQNRYLNASVRAWHGLVLKRTHIGATKHTLANPPPPPHWCYNTHILVLQHTHSGAATHTIWCYNTHILVPHWCNAQTHTHTGATTHTSWCCTHWCCQVHTHTDATKHTHTHWCCNTHILVLHGCYAQTHWCYKAYRHKHTHTHTLVAALHSTHITK